MSLFLLHVVRCYVVYNTAPVEDAFGGLEITIVATVSLGIVCIALIVVVIARCYGREKADKSRESDQEPSPSDSPTSLVAKSPEKTPPEAVWQDVPNCFVPESCSTLPRKSSERQTSPSHGHGDVSRPSITRLRATPETLTQSEATDVDSVFGAVTPIRGNSIAGDSMQPSHNGTPVTSRQPSTHKNTPGKRLSPGQVSLDGPEYGFQGGTSDRFSQRSYSCGHRPTNPSPLSTEPSPIHRMTPGRSSVDRGGMNQNASALPGSPSPNWRTLPHGTAPVTGDQQWSRSNGNHLHLPSTRPHRTNGDVLQGNTPSPIPYTLQATIPIASSPTSAGLATQPVSVSVNGQPMRTADPVYSYDSLKAEVDALRQQTMAAGSVLGSQSWSRHNPQYQRSADV